VRRTLSYVLVGLGVFAVTLGLLFRFYVYPLVAKVPLDVDVVSVAQGEGITSVVIEDVDGVPTPSIREGLSVTSTSHVTGDLTREQVVADGDVAVWIEATRTVDDDSGILLSAYVRSLCLDRRTNEAVAPCDGQYLEEQRGVRVDGAPNLVQQPGYSFKFPFGTEKRGYRVYDMSVKRTVEARFDGEDTVKGVDVYRFVVEVEPTRIGTEEVPGALVGSAEPSVRVDQYYQDERTIWVEPATGVWIAAQDTGRRELVAPGQRPGEGVVVYEGTMKLTDRSVEDNIRQATDNTGRLALLTVWPVAMWIAGLVLIAAGAALLFLRRRPT
jgi:hypothetical protein